MKTEFTARMAGLLWAASFFLSLGMLPGVEAERLTGVILGAAASGLLVASGGDMHRRVVAAPFIALLLVLFWLLAVSSLAWSVAPYVSLIGLGGFTLVPATILAILSADPKARDIFLRFAVWGTGIVVAGISLWALVQVFLMPEFLVSGQVRHPFPNPNAYAALLSLSFFAGIGLFLKETSPKTRMALWVGLFLALCALSAIAGKAATLGLAVGVAALLLVSGKTFLPQNWKPLLGLGLAVFAVSVAMALMPNKKNVVSLLSGLVMGETGTLDNRLDIWRSTFALIAAHPWLGTGYKTFSLMYPSVRLPEDVFSSGWMVHSDPLQFWAEMGILGAVLFYAIGIAVLMKFIFFWRTDSGAAPRRTFILSLFLGCAAFIAHSHVDFLFYTLPTMMAFALALPVLVVWTAKEPTATPFSFMANWPQGLRLLAIFTPVLAVIALHIPVMAGEIFTVKAGRLIRGGDVDGFAVAVNQANTVGMGWNARPYTMAATVPLSILKNQSATMPLEEQQALFRQIDGLLKNALMRNSRLAPAWYHRGDMVNFLNDDILPPGYWTAEESFAMALALDPLHLPSRIALADVYQTSGRMEQALDVLLAGVHWPYPVADPMDYYNRTEILARALGRTDVVTKIAHARDYHLRRVDTARQRKAALDRAKDNNIFIP